MNVFFWTYYGVEAVHVVHRYDWGSLKFGDTLLRSEGKVPLYNGRISSRKVREGRYDYGYDSFGRLTEAAFSGNGDADNF